MDAASGTTRLAVAALTEAYVYSAPAPRLRLVFPKPGFFLFDVPVRLLINGHPVFQGGFMQGILVEVPMVEGTHYVDATISGPVDRNKRYAIEVRPGCVTEVELSYSRMWGNFTGAPAVRYLPG